MLRGIVRVVRACKAPLQQWNMLSRGVGTWSVEEIMPKASTSLSKEELVQLARQARLDVTLLSEEELERLQMDLSNILACAESVQQVDTSGVEPMISSLEEFEMDCREDVVSETGQRDGILQNAPEVRDGFFVVPVVRSEERKEMVDIRLE